MKLIRLFGSNLFVAAVFSCIFYGIPYYLLTEPLEPHVPIVLKVAILAALAGVLITLGTVIVEQRKTL